MMKGFTLVELAELLEKHKIRSTPKELMEIATPFVGLPVETLKEIRARLLADIVLSPCDY